MEAKLAANRHKGDRPGWLALDLTVLARCLFNELDELEQALSHGDANAVLEEAADVANFAMMLADKFALQQQQLYRQQDSLAELFRKHGKPSNPNT